MTSSGQKQNGGGGAGAEGDGTERAGREGRGEAVRGCEATAVLSRPAGAAAEHVGGQAGVQAG